MQLDDEDLKIILLLLEAYDKNIIYFPEWIEDNYDLKIDNKRIKRIINKIKKEVESDDIDKIVNLIRYDPYNDEIDYRVYDTLRKAFNDKKRVSVRYFSYNKGVFTDRDIDIYHMTSKYIIAFDHASKEIRKFRASRFAGAKILDIEYSIPPFNKKEYL